MSSGRIDGMPAGIAVVSALTIFFFPAMQGGPYSVVHGPVTALLSVKAADLRMAIVRAGVNAVRSCLSFARLAPFSFSLQGTALPSAEFAVESWAAGFSPILRC